MELWNSVFAEIYSARQRSGAFTHNILCICNAQILPHHSIAITGTGAVGAATTLLLDSGDELVSISSMRIQNVNDDRASGLSGAVYHSSANCSNDKIFFICPTKVSATDKELFQKNHRRNVL